MKKQVLISVLDDNEKLARLLGEEAGRVGLMPSVHLWQDDLANMAWMPVAQEAARENCRVWIVAGSEASFANPVTRKGLSLVALAAQAAHGSDFPILLSPATGTLDPAAMPTPLAGAEVVKNGLGAKAAVRANSAIGNRPEYRLVPHGLPGLGLWFEVGPARDPWVGAFFGCSGSPRTDAAGNASVDAATEPDAHGVGKAGSIPSTSTLHYPVRGLRLTVGEQEGTAWGVKNELSLAESYYVRLNGTPDAIVFGAFPDTDEAEAFTVRLA